MYRNTWGRRRERKRSNNWRNKDWEFSQINVRHQTTDPESSENTKHSNSSPPPDPAPCPKNTKTKKPCTYCIQTTENQKIKKKILKEAKGKQYLICNGAKIRITSKFPSETRQGRREWGETEGLGGKNHTLESVSCEASFKVKEK